MSPATRHPFYDATPHEIELFIASKVVVGNRASCLPEDYPQLNELQAYQEGYRWLTGESLVSTKPGDWQPGWYVIARNYFDDPFFIDINEQTTGFPVHFALHGTGRWMGRWWRRVCSTSARYCQHCAHWVKTMQNSCGLLRLRPTCRCRFGGKFTKHTVIVTTNGSARICRGLRNWMQL